MKTESPADILKKIHENTNAVSLAMAAGDYPAAGILAEENRSLFLRLARKVPLRDQHYREQAKVWLKKAEEIAGAGRGGSVLPPADFINDEVANQPGENSSARTPGRTGTDMPAHRVFISYSKPDQALAQEICSYLESDGIFCWIAPRNVRPGLDFPGSIIDAIDTCSVVVLVFSASSNNSPHVVRELTRAVTRNIPIIPFRTEDVIPTKNMDYLINVPHWLDAFPAPAHTYFVNLADTIRMHLGDLPSDDRLHNKTER